MLKIMAWLVSLGLVASPMPKVTSEVDRTEDGDIAVTLVYVDRGYREDCYTFDIPQDEFQTYKLPGDDLKVDTAVGSFSGKVFEVTNPDGKKEMFYQFKSYDNEVWWCLTEEEIGFIPEEGASYLLAYYQNETTRDNHECPEEYDCDCYCYDDLYLGVYGL